MSFNAPQVSPGASQHDSLSESSSCPSSPPRIAPNDLTEAFAADGNEPQPSPGRPRLAFPLRKQLGFRVPDDGDGVSPGVRSDPGSRRPSPALSPWSPLRRNDPTRGKAAQGRKGPWIGSPRALLEGTKGESAGSRIFGTLRARKLPKSPQGSSKGFLGTIPKFFRRGDSKDAADRARESGPEPGSLPQPSESDVSGQSDPSSFSEASPSPALKDYPEGHDHLRARKNWRVVRIFVMMLGE